MAEPVQEKLLALDIGGKRIGVAVASLASRLAEPLTTLTNDQGLMSNLKQLIDEHAAQQLVIGLPRGLDGQDTAQTTQIKSMAEDIKSKLSIKIVFQDEALTSVKAEEELSSRGRIYQKEDVDKLAATYILQDYINENIRPAHE